MGVTFEYTALDGKTYHAEVGTITGTHLGYEDHGVFTANIDFAFDRSSHQGTGHLILGGSAEAVRNTKYSERVHHYLAGVLAVCGVDTWEQLPRLKIAVLRDQPFQQIHGLLNLTTSAEFFFTSIGDN